MPQLQPRKIKKRPSSGAEESPSEKVVPTERKKEGRFEPRWTGNWPRKASELPYNVSTLNCFKWIKKKTMIIPKKKVIHGMQCIGEFSLYKYLYTFKNIPQILQWFSNSSFAACYGRVLILKDIKNQGYKPIGFNKLLKYRGCLMEK